MTYQVVDLVGVAGEMLVDEVERVPAEEDVFVVHLALSEGGKGLVHEVSYVKLYRGLEPFFFHPVSTVAAGREAVIAADLFQVLHDLRANEVALAGVCQDADVAGAS